MRVCACSNFEFAAAKDRRRGRCATHGDLRAALRPIYGALYAGLALKNPAHEAGAAVRSERFCAELDKYVASLWG